MLPLLRRILTARAMAATVSVMTSALALHELPGAEYALASVAMAVASIAMPLLYQPFSKYVLISGDYEEVESAFWSFQPLIVLVVAVVVAAAPLVQHKIEFGLVIASGFFAMTQGWKEFCGELARARGKIAEMQLLYVFDALTTLVAVWLILLYYKYAWAFICASAVSSLFWSWRYLPKPQSVRWLSDRNEMASIYRYSYGLLGTNALNSIGLATARGAVLHASPPALSSSIQFVLDLLQKPMALLGSSAVTAVLPEIRKRSIMSVIPTLVAVMSAALLGFFMIVGLLSYLPINIFGKLDGLQPALLLACALFIWSNRYKSTVMDIPLTSSVTHVSKLLVGAVVSCLGLFAVASTSREVSFTLVAAATAILLGGWASLILAQSQRLISWRAHALMASVPLLAIAVVGSYVLLSGAGV